MTNTNVELLTDLADYCLWAEKRIIKALNKLSDDEFNHTNSFIGISLRNLCEHIAYNYEWHFYSENGGFTPVVEKTKKLSRKKLIDYWIKSVNDFVKAVNENIKDYYTVHEEYTQSGRSISLDCINYFLAITDHLTYHRGQILTHLRLLSKDTVNTDFFTYLIEKDKTLKK